MTAASWQDLAVEIAGETFILLPERAAYWTRTRTLLLADPHFGKAAAFRAAGIPVPSGATAEGLARLDAALTRTGARRIVCLGDFLHAREGRAPGTMHALEEWRRQHAELELMLVRGNHDRRAGDPPLELGISCVSSPHYETPFVFAHHPAYSSDGYVLAGHLHPGVRLSGPGRQHARLACFWLGPTVGVLPAFGDFTGLADVEPEEGDRVFVVVEQQVTEVSNQRSKPC